MMRTTRPAPPVDRRALDRLKGAVNHAMAAGASACAAWAFAAVAWPEHGLDRLSGLGLAALLAAFAGLNALRLGAVRRDSPRYARAVRAGAATVASALVLWGAVFFL